MCLHVLFIIQSVDSRVIKHNWSGEYSRENLGPSRFCSWPGTCSLEWMQHKAISHKTFAEGPIQSPQPPQNHELLEKSKANIIFSVGTQ